MSEEEKAKVEKKAPVKKVTTKKAPAKKVEKKKEDEVMILGRKPYPDDKKYVLTRQQRATLAGKGKPLSDVKRVWTGKELNTDPRVSTFNVKEAK